MSSSLHLDKLVVEVADHRHIIFDGQLTDRIRLGGQQGLFPRVASAAGSFGRDPVVGQLMGMDAGQQFRTTPDVEDALTQQRAQRSLLRGIDIRWRDEVGTQ